MGKRLSRDDLENFGSIITLKGTNQCLGDLMSFEGRGVYCPCYGLVPVTKEEADLHNKALDTAMIEGLDNQCEIGQVGYAYLHPIVCRDSHPGHAVKSFAGTVIAEGDDVEVSRLHRGGAAGFYVEIEFRRCLRHFRGRCYNYYSGGENFRFKRIQ